MNIDFFDNTVVQLAIGTSRCHHDVKKFIKGIQYAVNNGITVFESAERFGEWEAEETFGKTLKILKVQTSDLFMIGKCHPTRVHDVISSCENSLKKLNIDCFDLYLLHFDAPYINYTWLRDNFEELKHRGLIKNYGVGSIELNRLIEINKTLNGNFVANQVCYGPLTRNAENGLIDQHKQANIQLMAYSIFMGKFDMFSNNHEFINYCQSANVDPGALILRWVQRHNSIMPIVASYDINHLNHLLNDQIDISEHLDMFDKFFPNLKETTLQTN